MNKFLPLLTVLLLCSVGAFAQQNLFYNHYFINPSLYNPSFIAPEGYSTLYLNYRKQWIGIKGAPTTGTLNLHLPLSHKAGIALTAFQDEAGLLTTSSGLISFAYSIYFGKRVTDLNKLSFGIAAGVTNSRIKTDEDTDLTDPVLGSNTSAIDGQVGINYQFNRLRIAVSIPRIFDPYTASEKSFNTSGISQLDNTISSISYNFPISGRFSFEPWVTYRTFHNLDPQFEALGSLKIDKLLWFGGSYRQDYGAAAFFGLSIKDKLKVGYAYEFATDQTDQLGNGSHEAQVIFRIGKKQFSRPQVAESTSAEEAVAQANVLKEELKTQPEEEPVDEIPSDDPQPANNTEPTESVVTTPTPVTATPEIAPVDRPVAVRDSTRDVREQPKQAVTTLEGKGLLPGHYVVVGAFASVVNAKNYAATLKRSGYPASVAFHPDKGYYIVHMINAATLDEAKVLRDKYRHMSRYSFRDTWILSID
jgi:type IX secretion system PorP/SprF family membrane protein